MDARTVLQGAVFDLEAAVNFGADGFSALFGRAPFGSVI